MSAKPGFDWFIAAGFASSWKVRAWLWAWQQPKHYFLLWGNLVEIFETSPGWDLWVVALQFLGFLFISPPENSTFELMTLITLPRAGSWRLNQLSEEGSKTKRYEIGQSRQHLYKLKCILPLYGWWFWALFLACVQPITSLSQQRKCLKCFEMFFSSGHFPDVSLWLSHSKRWIMDLCVTEL